MAIQDDINDIANAESGESVRSAIISAIQDLNQNGGNAQTLNNHSSDDFTKKAEFDNFVDEEVGQIHLVLDAINKGTSLKVIDLGVHTIGPQGNVLAITVPESVKDRHLLTVDDFYADIVEIAAGSGENVHWTKTDSYDNVRCEYRYAYSALASAIKLHFYAKRASAIVVPDYDVHPYPGQVRENKILQAEAGEAWNYVDIMVPTGGKTEIEQTFNENGEFTPTDPNTTWGKVIIDVTAPTPELQTGSVSVGQATYHQEFNPTEPYVGFSKFTVDVNVPMPSIQNDRQVTMNTSGYVNPESGYDAMSTVYVTVPAQPSIQTDRSVTMNTSGYINPESGYDAMSTVYVTVPAQPSIQTGKSVTYSSGGTYTVNPSSGYDAMDSVEVTVQAPVVQQSKSVTLSQSGTVTPDPGYDAMEEVVVTVSGGGGGNCNIMDKATWDALTFDEKKEYGLTVIRKEGDTTGEWFDYSNISLPFSIRAELYQNTEGNISLPAMDNAIFFTGAWDNAAGNYDNLKLTATSLNYDTKISGSVTPYYWNTPLDKMVTILTNTSSCILNYRNGYSPNGYYSYGAVISVDDANATLSVLGDFNDTQTHVITTDEAYDGIICITSKGLQNGRGSNGLIEISGTYDSKYDGNEKLISDVSEACISIYSNVAAGAEITISTPLGNRAGSAVIGVKLNNS